MKFLTNLAACFFQEDDDSGQTVFYPWGALGRGRRIADPARAARIRRFLDLYYQIVFWMVIGLAMFQMYLTALALAALASLVYVLIIARLTRGCPSTAVRMQIAEAQQRMAEQYSPKTLKRLYWGSIILCVGSFGIFLGERESAERLLALVGMGLFGTGIWLFARLRRFKAEQAHKKTDGPEGPSAN